jgi:hypothetical protein
MGDEDENNMEDTSGYEKSVVRIDRWGLDDFVLGLLPTGSGLVPAVSGIVN